MSVSAKEIEPYAEWALSSGPFVDFVVEGVFLVEYEESFLGFFAAVKAQHIALKDFPPGLTGTLRDDQYILPPNVSPPQVVISVLGDPVNVSGSILGGRLAGKQFQTSDVTILDKRPQQYLVLGFSDASNNYRLSMSCRTIVKEPRTRDQGVFNPRGPSSQTRNSP